MLAAADFKGSPWELGRNYRGRICRSQDSLSRLSRCPGGLPQHLYRCFGIRLLPTCTSEFASPILQN